MTATGRESNLWGGYDRYTSHHGTLTADATETVTLGEPVAALMVQHQGGATNSLWVTIGTAGKPSPADPTSDGSGDTDDEMIEVVDGSEVSLNLNASEVKLRSAGAVRWQVVGLRS